MHAAQGGGEGLGRFGGKEEDGIREQFAMHGDVGAEGRTAAGDGLQRRYVETFVARGGDEGRRALVQLDQSRFIDEAQPVDQMRDGRADDARRFRFC